MSRRGLKLLCLTAALLLSAVAQGAGAGTSQNASHAARPVSVSPLVREKHPIDPLDHAVQQRFHEVVGFGMARIATERRFVPETKEEKEAVKGLRRAGYKLGLYLAGRGILEPVPVEYRHSKTKFGTLNGHTLSGPIFFTSSGLKRMPGGPALWEPTREALVAFGEGAERRAFAVGEWEVEARPVRATSESCLKCHTDLQFTIYPGVEKPAYGWKPREGSVLRVGDPLGVLLYVYKKKSR